MLSAWGLWRGLPGGPGGWQRLQERSGLCMEPSEEVYRLLLGTGRAARRGRAGEGDLEIALPRTLARACTQMWVCT